MVDPEAALAIARNFKGVASRQTFDNPPTIRLYSPIEVIPYLAWYDREVAAALFEPTRERIERTDDRELATWQREFEAWSHFDPAPRWSGSRGSLSVTTPLRMRTPPGSPSLPPWD